MDDIDGQSSNQPDINQDEIRKIAHLARIEINSEAELQLSHDLVNILNLVRKINNHPTDNVVPMAHPLEMSQRLRPDQTTENDRHEEFQAIAPQVQDGLYLVPKVIE